MALDAASFVARYPEFTEINEVASAAIDAAISDAKEFVDQGVWKTRYEAAVLCKAAHILAMSPLGEAARLDKKGDRTTYGVVFEEMRKALPIRMMVL
jgi:hypothetical protein